MTIWADACGLLQLVLGPAVFSCCLPCSSAKKKHEYDMCLLSLCVYFHPFFSGRELGRGINPTRLELIDVTMDPPPELQLPTPAPVTVPAVPVPAVPAAGFTFFGCNLWKLNWLNCLQIKHHGSKLGQTKCN